MMVFSIDSRLGRYHMHTTNDTNTFMSVAEDCPAATGDEPPVKREPTMARLQYEMILEHPYRYTSDEVLFAVHATRKHVPAADREAERDRFFSRGQACLRASSLGKRYGWGVHHDAHSKVALHARGSETYRRLSQDPTLKQVKAMRNAR